MVFVQNLFFFFFFFFFFFVKNVLFLLRNTKVKTASHSDHPLKGNGRFCVSHFGPFYCLMQFNILLDLLFKNSYLAFECSDLDGVFSFALAVMWTTFSGKKNQTFEIFGKKHVFKQNSKISGIPSL